MQHGIPALYTLGYPAHKLLVDACSLIEAASVKERTDVLIALAQSPSKRHLGRNARASGSSPPPRRWPFSEFWRERARRARPALYDSYMPQGIGRAVGAAYAR